MQRALSLEDTPPLAVPLRFMLTAPWFACAAGLLLAWAGPDALSSRWTPAALALTHLMTLGLLAMTMLGAMLQMLPVVADLAVPAATLVARFSWYGLTAGALLLAAAFLAGLPLLFILAALALASSVPLFAVAAARALARSPVAGALAMTNGMRLALASLGLTLALGLVLAAGLAGLGPVPLLKVTGLHAAWGLVGWVAVLVVAVSFQVIPMFQATGVYPRWLTLALPPSLVAMLALWSGSFWRGAGWTAWAQALIGLLVAVYAGLTLYKLARRTRAPDVTTLYWFLSLASLLACLLAYFVMDAGSAQRAPLAGILFIAGFAASAVNGMLYKIVPFLLWYHLGAAGVPRRAVPGVNAWITERNARAQFCAWTAALLMMEGAVLVPALARPAGLLFALAGAWLGWMLAAAALRYRRAVLASAGVGA